MLDFYKGMDISFLPQYLDEGMQVCDMDGTPTEPFSLLMKYGVNAIRLRIWNNPNNVKESKGYCSLDHTLQMARKIAASGMSFLLDFHYSDFWADPAHQKKPREWEDLSREQLENAVYTYTRDTLRTLERQGTLPDMVQIGNEIRSGLLFPEGELPDYEGMVRLINAGIRGAREVAGPERMQVMIHLDQGGRYDWLHRWFEGAFSCGLSDFDVIGLSYYPFWHGTYLDLRDSMKRLAADYGKPIIIAETAYAWRESKKGFIDEEQIRIGGLPATPEGQLKELQSVMHLVAELPDKLGRGIYYWEPLCVPGEDGGWAENMGLLDCRGRIMEGILAFSQDRSDMERVPKDFEELLERVKRSDELNREYAGENLLKNGDFFDCEKGWRIEKSEEMVGVSFEEGEPGSTSKILRVESPKNFAFLLEQSVQLAEAGDYLLTAEIKGVDTTGVEVQLFAKGDGEWKTPIHPTEQWKVYSLTLKKSDIGNVRVGIHVASPMIYFCLRNLRLTRQEESAARDTGETGNKLE